MKKVTFIIPKYLEDGFGVKIGIITANISDDSPLFTQWKFQDALMKALLEWVKTTSDGKKVYEAHRKEISVAVLISEQPFSHLLTTILAKHGILDFQIQMMDNNNSDDMWQLDDTLVDWNAVKE